MEVTLIGTGLMGFPMTKALLEASYDVTVYNRTIEKAAPLAEAGARTTNSPGEAVEAGECIILMVTDAEAIEEVLFSNDMIPLTGKTVIQMGTIAPDESRDFAKRIEKVGGDYLEAPVLGNKSDAAKGELFVMVGGTEEQFNRWNILLKTFGSLHYIGEVGTAAALKLALNQFIASLTATFGLSLRLIQKNGVDLDVFMDILRDSALYSPQYDKKLPRILQSDYSDPNFPTQHLLKDVDLMIQAANDADLEDAAIKGIRQVIRNAIDKGFVETDYSSLVEGITK
ncbi:MAG: NAD(P)-dependent oxidoreductase [Candidatus Marinimicrobia bacterium]|nr:NAD(P)-dependent oxidoreductase [Candidatus Neomarinimicrobiota bacterium]MCF7829990.1 NAD(P)-dependent oxidoreductase [Candidatus Neomarinimicrobiota bacterium]MCF7881856.1 NAD(P)-dependent oxidoreductase [Candidatus Neomarinimicrobiota bacterium]